MIYNTVHTKIILRQITPRKQRNSSAEKTVVELAADTFDMPVPSREPRRNGKVLWNLMRTTSIYMPWDAVGGVLGGGGVWRRGQCPGMRPGGVLGSARSLLFLMTHLTRRSALYLKGRIHKGKSQIEHIEPVTSGTSDASAGESTFAMGDKCVIRNKRLVYTNTSIMPP